ncbi:helix-turn-helix domain-containing protein [Fodinisporobacter ferrooxydans]|uniref:Helix-turn-helix domain-containing protein n=1 Tax=Fodinisporobacter ferrooxydans TaxID=2901836 RepID=A0ABY4CFC6_9BACL|nr:helix-turn-helix domain-containing protein [Alicyclobacillaceae bacterium MYW30-H2]
MENNSIGERLAQLRLKHGLSQAELAKKLNISQSTLAMYETNKREPNLYIIEKFSYIFMVSTDYLILGKDFDINTFLNHKWGVPKVTEIPCEDYIISQNNVESYFNTPLSWIDSNSEYVWYGIKKEDSITVDSDNNSWVLIRLTSDVKNGEMAAVCVNGNTAILRRVWNISEDLIMLIPYLQTKSIPPVLYQKDTIKIRGIVEMLITGTFL